MIDKRTVCETKRVCAQLGGKVMKDISGKSDRSHQLFLPLKTAQKSRVFRTEVTSVESVCCELKFG